MNGLMMSWRMLRRDLRAGELGLLLLALVIAVASLSSVGFFTDRVGQGLKRQANQLLGGDLVLVSDHPIPADYISEARKQGLDWRESSTLPTMASHGEQFDLAAVKAVEEGHPLRGEVRIAPGISQPDQPAGRIPARGEVWLDERLAGDLRAYPGDEIRLGAHRFRVGAILSYESDRGMNFFSLLPRLMMNRADLAATQLIQPGSRAMYRLHLAGENNARLEAYETWARNRLGRGESLETLDNARPELRTITERTERFLRFAAMLAVVLAAVAAGLASRRFVERHLDGCAVMRCLGARQPQLLGLFAGEFLLLGLMAGVAGCVLGFGVQFGLNALIGDLVGFPLPAPGYWPVLHGLAVSLVLMLGFAMPPLIRLGRVPTLRVLRRELGSVGLSESLAWGVGALALTGLLVVIAQDLTLGGAVTGGFALAFVLFGLVARAALAGLGRFGGSAASGWRYGLSALARRPWPSLIQVLALALGITALLLLTLVRGDLLASWQGSTPPDAHNRFILNIQPEQIPPLQDVFRAAQYPAPAFQPMIRGRLTAVNGKLVKGSDFTEERAKRLAEREFNLSQGEQVPEGNRIIQGAWDKAQPGFSVEQGLAAQLGLKLGDVLRFDVAGVPVEAPITSVRNLDWSSMRVNFFVVATPGLLDAANASYITSFYLPPGREALIRSILAAQPNLTVVDVGAVITQVRGMIEQLIKAIQFVFSFALVAGVVVMLGALQSTHDERERELAILRTLGARNHQLRGALLGEFAALGLLAGLLAGLGANGIGWAVAHWVFKLDYMPSLLPLLVGGLAGGVLVTGAGWLATRGLLRRPPLASLRALA